MRKAVISIAIALGLLSGCGESPSADGPGGLTAEDARALDAAAAKLETEPESPSAKKSN